MPTNPVEIIIIPPPPPPVEARLTMSLKVANFLRFLMQRASTLNAIPSITMATYFNKLTEEEKIEFDYLYTNLRNELSLQGFHE